MTARTGVPRSPDGTPWPACTATGPHFTVTADQTEGAPLELSPVCEVINSRRLPAPS
ncbi:hypothetical protein ABZ719_33335 [Streptomyces sp. NPDC006743]|uniref:hypothetical protein n=1 Tax=Streptomyces sp. NPDC006743 TaxID=3154480 RepID=UPI0034532E66